MYDGMNQCSRNILCSSHFLWWLRDTIDAYFEWHVFKKVVDCHKSPKMRSFWKAAVTTWSDIYVTSVLRWVNNVHSFHYLKNWMNFYEIKTLTGSVEKLLTNFFLNCFAELFSLQTTVTMTARLKQQIEGVKHFEFFNPDLRKRYNLSSRLGTWKLWL